MHTNCILTLEIILKKYRDLVGGAGNLWVGH